MLTRITREPVPTASPFNSFPAEEPTRLVRPLEVGAANCRELKSSGPCGSRMHEARKPCEEKIMLYYALVFLVIAIIAGILGFTGIAGTSAWIAHVLFVVFLVLFIVSLIFRGRPSV